MYSFYITGNNIKKFMNILLKGDKFDKFEVRSCELTTFVKFEVDCRLNKDWLDEDTDRIYCKWQELKPYVFEIIKGKKKPKNMKFVMALSQKCAEKVHPNALACFINIVFEENKVVVTTGTAQKEFSLDKSPELFWEDKIKGLFNSIEIIQNIV